MNTNLHTKAIYIKNMDEVINMINDAESDIVMDWKECFVPDESSIGDIEEILKWENDKWYNELCEFFATSISKMVIKGNFNKDGFTTEFFKLK